LNAAASWRSLKKLLVSELGDIRSGLSTADPVLNAEVYGDGLGLRTIYRPADNALALRRGPKLVSEEGLVPKVNKRSCGPS
jgi:hypothetical protein